MAALAGTAGADEPSFDPAPTAECLAAGEGAACIGRAARACWGDDPVTMTVGLCFGEEHAWWEARMAAARAALKERDIAWDLGQREHDFPSEAFEQGKAAQAAFLAYREERCAYVAAIWGPGSGSGPAWAECMMRATAEHVLWLEDWIERY